MQLNSRSLQLGEKKKWKRIKDVRRSRPNKSKTSMKSWGELTRNIVQIIKYVATQLENRSQESIRSECKKNKLKSSIFFSLYIYISYSWMPFENVIKEHFQREGQNGAKHSSKSFCNFTFFSRFFVQYFSSRNATPIPIITCFVFFCFAHIPPRFRIQSKFINYYLLILVFRKKKIDELIISLEKMPLNFQRLVIL